MTGDSFSLALNSIGIALQIIAQTWWLWLPVFLIVTLWSAIGDYNRLKYISSIKWVLLEIKVPLEPHKSPKAMEQVFAALHVIGVVFQPKDLLGKFYMMRDRVFKGRVPDWFSFELASIGGEIHYYVRVPEGQRRLVESQIYAYYPEAELTQVADYLAPLPAVAPNEEYNATGAELGLEKNDIFPIRTYAEFEEQGVGKDDFKRIDPLASLTEVLNDLQYSEVLGVQYLLRSATDAWIKKGQAELDKIFEKPEKPRNDFGDNLISGVESTVGAIFGATPVEKKEEKKEAKSFGQLGPGMQETVKAIERSFTKYAFQVGIRIMYTAPRERYVKERLSAANASFKVLSSKSLNGFKGAFMPEVFRGRNKAAKTIVNKQIIYRRYLNREFPAKPFILNTEEMATVFHFPDVSVRTPSLPRVESKKGEPPSTLPTV